MSILSELKVKKIGKILKNEPMSKYTTYKIGGNADYIVFPSSIEKLQILLCFIKEKNIPYKVIGHGSNLIFSDENYKGIIIKLDELDNLEINGTLIKVGSGYPTAKLSLRLSKMGLTGFEFASALPGSIGGAVYMNAGCYNSDMGYVVREVKVLTPGNTIITLYNKDLDYHYRSSFFQSNPGFICLEATIVLKHGDKAEIMKIIEDRKERRISSQPLNFPSAGSVFRNPPDLSAWKLIEDCGLKGKRIGGAMVSEMHANFIINVGGATAKDVKELIELIKAAVLEKFSINMKCEQEFVNFE